MSGVIIALELPLDTSSVDQCLVNAVTGQVNLQVDPYCGKSPQDANSSQNHAVSVSCG